MASLWLPPFTGLTSYLTRSATTSSSRKAGMFGTRYPEFSKHDRIDCRVLQSPSRCVRQPSRTVTASRLRSKSTSMNELRLARSAAKGASDSDGRDVCQPINSIHPCFCHAPTRHRRSEEPASVCHLNISLLRKQPGSRPWVISPSLTSKGRNSVNIIFEY